MKVKSFLLSWVLGPSVPPKTRKNLIRKSVASSDTKFSFVVFFYNNFVNKKILIVFNLILTVFILILLNKSNNFFNFFFTEINKRKLLKNKNSFDVISQKIRVEIDVILHFHYLCTV